MGGPHHTRPLRRRHAADACAQYVGSCMVDPVHVSPASSKLVKGLWLIWSWEGTLTLSHHLRSPSFPRDLVPALLGKEAFKGNTQVVRANSAAVELVVAQTVMRQLLSSLSTLHGVCAFFPFSMCMRDVEDKYTATRVHLLSAFLRAKDPIDKRQRSEFPQ